MFPFVSVLHQNRCLLYIQLLCFHIFFYSVDACTRQTPTAEATAQHRAQCGSATDIKVDRTVFEALANLGRRSQWMSLRQRGQACHQLKPALHLSVCILQLLL